MVLLCFALQVYKRDIDGTHLNTQFLYTPSNMFGNEHIQEKNDGKVERENT